MIKTYATGPRFYDSNNRLLEDGVINITIRLSNNIQYGLELQYSIAIQ
jgi:hypothetical protein